MTTLHLAILIGHTVVALITIALVLLQRGKGADAGAAFGSGASGTVFGARGSSNFFSRATAILATVFFVSSLGLAYLSSQTAGTTDSILQDAAPLVEEAEDITVQPGALPELGEPGEPSVDDSSNDLPELPPAPGSEDTDSSQQ